MMAGVSGDFDLLARYMANVRLATKPEFRKELNAVIAEEALEYVQGRFEAQRDPQGKAWRPRTSFMDKEGNAYFTRKKGGGTGQILRSTGRLQRSLSSGLKRVTANEFRVSTRLRYAAIHQYGGKITPKKGKSLAFNVYGAAGAMGIYATSVTMPRRAYMPEDDSPPALDLAIEEATDAFMGARL